jgi:SAM-dependent methyltransferase
MTARAGSAAGGQASRPAGGPRLTGSRTIQLLRLFRAEQSDPDRFYEFLAADAAGQLAAHCDLDGRVVIDIGGGAGYFSAAFRAAGARCCLFDIDTGEMLARGRVPANAAVGDGCRLPVRDGGADVCFSSNVLEHVPDPMAFISEMVRVTRPGGIVYLAFTNWLSPWGGHEMSPWHYFGGRFAERRYARRRGRPPKHVVGRSLFRVHIGPVLRHVRERGDVQVLDARPRYYPAWTRPLVRVPGIRELATWNLLLILRRVR